MLKKEKIRYAINYTKTTETFFESRDSNIQEISFVEKYFCRTHNSLRQLKLSWNEIGINIIININTQDNQQV